MQRKTLHQHKKLNQQLGIIAGILIGSAGLVWIAAVVAINAQKPVQTEAPAYTIAEPEVAVIEPTGILIPRRTNGEAVDASIANAQPFAIMIENAAFGGVRPQFGLSRAEIVYEVVVEGGITRFMAIYSGNDLPEKIGPVRSARPTFIEFVSEYDAVYAHAGGSPEALQEVSGLQIKDLNALEAGGAYFERDAGRSAPHNLFTSNTYLQKALLALTLQKAEAKFTSWKFIDTADTSKPEATASTEKKTIDIDFGSGPLYAVRYEYNAANKTYTRFNGGELQVDANTNEPLSISTVIVQKVDAGVEVGESRINFNVTGQGEAAVYIGGKEIKGTWKKADRVSRTQYFDETGNEIQLAPGQIWVTILPSTGSYTAS